MLTYFDTKIVQFTYRCILFC